VLSPSTQAFDVGEKFRDYQRLETLEEYVLISQESQQVECFRRVSGNRWETEVSGVGEQVMLKSIGLEFAIDQLYRGLDS
jgi:Uma2 family endonuclease